MLEEEKEIIVPRNRSFIFSKFCGLFTFESHFIIIIIITIIIKYMVMCFNCSNATSHTPTTPIKITPLRPLNESHSITDGNYICSSLYYEAFINNPLR